MARTKHSKKHAPSRSGRRARASLPGQDVPTSQNGREVPITAVCKAGFEIPGRNWRPHQQKSLALDCDGAFVVQGNSMWPLVADGQYVLYKDVHAPAELQTGDIVLAKLPSGETLIKAWYPVDGQDDRVFLVSLYRGPEVFRKDLVRPYALTEFEQLRRVVGIWLG